MLRIGENGLADVDHHRQIEGRGGFLGAPERLEITSAGHVVGQPCLDTDHHIAMASDRTARQVDVGTIDVHQFAAGRNAGSGDVDQQATQVGPCLHDGRPFIDAIGSERPRIDVPGDAVQQAQGRTFLRRGRV